MKPTEILTSEHRVIEQVLNCLEAIVGRPSRRAGSTGHRPRTPSLSSAISPTVAITARRKPTCSPPWRPRVFRATADRPASCSTSTSKAAPISAAWTKLSKRPLPAMPTALQLFVANAGVYVSLLREHIYKEDHILFSLADRVFTDEDQQDCSPRSGKSRPTKSAPARTQKYLQIAQDLAKRYGVAAATAALSAGQFHCRPWTLGPRCREISVIESACGTASTILTVCSRFANESAVR